MTNPGRQLIVLARYISEDLALNLLRFFACFRSETCLQIALAIKDEVQDLEKAGISIIQIDEAALREGLPLRKADQAFYLDWAVQSFRITNCAVQDSTQVCLLSYLRNNASLPGNYGAHTFC